MIRTGTFWNGLLRPEPGSRCHVVALETDEAGEQYGFVVAQPIVVDEIKREFIGDNSERIDKVGAWLKLTPSQLQQIADHLSPSSN